MSIRLQQFSKISRSLLWLNLLSLDALLVALVWQDFFARQFHVPLPVSSRVLLALCAWLAYAGDRWLDGFKMSDSAFLLPRHRFARQNRRMLLTGWLLAFALAALIAGSQLEKHQFFGGLMLAAVVGGYLFLYQYRQTANLLWGYKEAAVGLLFALATVVLVLPARAWQNAGIISSVCGWALVCFFNCYGIAGWERKQDLAQQQHSLVTRWPKLLRWYRTVTWGAALVFLLAAISIQPIDGWPIPAALMLSCIFLGLLDWLNERGHIQSDWLRLAADLVLLTPLLFF